MPQSSCVSHYPDDCHDEYVVYSWHYIHIQYTYCIYTNVCGCFRLRSYISRFLVALSDYTLKDALG